MQSFKKYKSVVELNDICSSYGSYDTFLNLVEEVVDQEKYQKAKEEAKAGHSAVVEDSKKQLKDHLSRYGRDFNDSGDLSHLNDDSLFKEREAHLKHIKHLYENDKPAYNRHMQDARGRLKGVETHGENKKTATMQGEKVDGKEVVATISNKGQAGAVTKIGKGEKETRHSTCVGSTDSCRGKDLLGGAACLGKVGCFNYPKVKSSNMTLENLKTMKAPASNGAGYDYHDEHGNRTKASPHLDYASIEYDTKVKALEHAKKESEKSGETKIVSDRDNTQNEESAMHHDQLRHHMPEKLKKHHALNNYSAIPAKSHYDTAKPSDASTHDGKMQNTNFSLKGPHVTHDQHGNVVETNRSSNIEDASKAMTPKTDENGKEIAPGQNAYGVVGGHVDGVLLRHPKGKKIKGEDGEVKDQKEPFHKDKAPKWYGPHAALAKVKTARVWQDEKKLQHDEPDDFHHPDGWGHKTFVVDGKKRTWNYQDHHVHTNIAKPDEKGVVDVNTLNDNVGSDERKPKGKDVRKNRKGQKLGSFHLTAATSATNNNVASGVVKTKDGKKVGDRNGVANDPFTFPIQHHLDKEDHTLFHMNHPLQAEEAKKKSIKPVAMNFHPINKKEAGELK